MGGWPARRRRHDRRRTRRVAGRRARPAVDRARRVRRGRYDRRRAGHGRPGGCCRRPLDAGRARPVPRRRARRRHRRDLLRAAQQVRDEARRAAPRRRAAPLRRGARRDRLLLRIQHARRTVDRADLVAYPAEGRGRLPEHRADRTGVRADLPVAARERRRRAKGRDRRVQPARRRRRQLRPRGSRHHRAGRAPLAGARLADRHAVPRPVPGRHDLPEGAGRRLPGDRHDVPRPGADRDQAARLLARRDRAGRAARADHDARARHRVRHRGPRHGRRRRDLAGAADRVPDGRRAPHRRRFGVTLARLLHTTTPILETPS
ncbi:Uncharacterised protein [Clostridium sporogenes]|nr:Uncharacterised protein [Clostridium sporogenes]